MEKRRQYNPIPYALDFVFCIDASEGMGLALPRVKEQICSFVSGSKEHIERFPYRNLGLMRARIVLFRNYKYDGPNSMLATVFFNLFQERDSFARCLASIHASVGGGSTEQSGLEALAYAMRSSWTNRDGSLRRRQIVSLWTNSSPCELGYGKENDLYPRIGMAKDFQELTSWWENADVIDPMAKRLVLFAPNEGYWKQISENWDNVIHFYSNAGEGMDKVTMDSLINCCFDV